MKLFANLILMNALMTMTPVAMAVCDQEIPNGVELIVGDWSMDGHEKVDRFLICSSLDKASLNEAFATASKKIGFNFSYEVADDYEDNLFPKEYIDLLRERGIEFTLSDEDSANDDGSVALQPKDFVNVWLAIAAFGNPSLKYNLIQPSTQIGIGGYGLYY